MQPSPRRADALENVLSRRSFLGRSALSLAAIACPVAIASPVRAALECRDDSYNGQRTCTAGIRSAMIVSTAANTVQYASQWCWAACIEGVFQYYGHRLSQQDIVRQVYGGVVDMPANPDQLLRILNGAWVDADGRRFSASADAFTVSAETAAQHLAADMPLIIGTMGHAMVLTALTYTAFPSYWGGQAEVIDAVVRDPWPGRGRRSLTAAEWYGIEFAARIRVG